MNDQKIEEFMQHAFKTKRKLMGFGHRVYKNYDPRAKVMQQTCHEVLDELGHALAGARRDREVRRQLQLRGERELLEDQIPGRPVDLVEHEDAGTARSPQPVDDGRHLVVDPLKTFLELNDPAPEAPPHVRQLAAKHNPVLERGLPRARHADHERERRGLVTEIGHAQGNRSICAGLTDGSHPQAANCRVPPGRRVGFFFAPNPG